MSARLSSAMGSWVVAAADVEAAVVEIVVGSIGLYALAVVEQALAAAAAAVAGRGRRVPAIVEAGFAREGASGAAAAPRRWFGGTRPWVARGPPPRPAAPPGAE